jgi:hypothetical protein
VSDAEREEMAEEGRLTIGRWQDGCPNCEHQPVGAISIPETRTDHGVTLAYWCTKCSHRWHTWYPIPPEDAAVLRAYLPSELPPQKRRRKESLRPPECARCGSISSLHEHHWAPKYLFDDADEWGTVTLCRQCHRRWHEVMTPDAHMKRTWSSFVGFFRWMEAKKSE